MVANDIKISNQALTTAIDQIQRAKDIIARVNTLLSKADLVRQTKTAWLEEMTTRSIQIQQQEVEKRSALKEIRSRLAKVAIFDRE